MAQQTTVILTDDMDGGKAVETVSFGLDGKQYVIDLGTKNAKNLRKAVAAYIEAGRKVKTNGGTRSATKKPAPSAGPTWPLSALGRTRTASLSQPAAASPHRSRSSTWPRTTADPETGCQEAFANGHSAEAFCVTAAMCRPGRAVCASAAVPCWMYRIIPVVNAAGRVSIRNRAAWWLSGFPGQCRDPAGASTESGSFSGHPGSAHPVVSWLSPEPPRLSVHCYWTESNDRMRK